MTGRGLSIVLAALLCGACGSTDDSGTRDDAGSSTSRSTSSAPTSTTPTASTSTAPVGSTIKLSLRATGPIVGVLSPVADDVFAFCGLVPRIGSGGQDWRLDTKVTIGGKEHEFSLRAGPYTRPQTFDGDPRVSPNAGGELAGGGTFTHVDGGRLTIGPGGRSGTVDLKIFDVRNTESFGTLRGTFTC